MTKQAKNNRAELGMFPKNNTHQIEQNSADIVWRMEIQSTDAKAATQKELIRE
jgi:hypothetical protein